MPLSFQPYDPPRPLARDLVRPLWRMQRAARTLTAALYRHPNGVELRIALEAEEADRSPNGLLFTRIERFNVEALQLESERMRAHFLDEAWV